MEHHQWWLIVLKRLCYVVSTAQSTVNHGYLRLLSSLVPWKLHYSPMELRMQVQLTNVPNPSSSVIFFSILTRPSKTQLSTWFLKLTYSTHHESTFYIVNIRFLWDRSRWMRLGTDTIPFQVAFMERSEWPLGQSGHCHLTWHGWSRCHHRKMWSRMCCPSAQNSLRNHDDQKQVHSKKIIVGDPHLEFFYPKVARVESGILSAKGPTGLELFYTFFRT